MATPTKTAEEKAEITNKLIAEAKALGLEPAPGATDAQLKRSINAKKKEIEAAKAEPQAPKLEKKVLTAEDFELDPSLANEGYQIGDTVEVEVETTEDEADAAVSENAIVEPKKGATSVDIVKSDVEYIRTYSEGVHGEDFMDLAKEFVLGHPNTKIVASESIKKLNVHYKALDKKTGVTFTKVEVCSSKENALRIKSTHAGAYIRIAR